MAKSLVRCKNSHYLFPCPCTLVIGVALLLLLLLLLMLLLLLLLQMYLTGVRLSFQEVEKLIVKAVKQRQVKVTVDHKVSCYTLVVTCIRSIHILVCWILSYNLVILFGACRLLLDYRVNPTGRLK